MNNIVILVGAIILLIVIFLIIFLLIGKQKINDLIIPLDISKEEINKYLKQKYKLFKEIINFIKDNKTIKEDAFQKFLSFDSKECLQSDLIDMLNETTYEINEYVDNFDDLLKNKDFLELKRKLYNTQVGLEATIDFYNNKISIYNKLKDKAPTSFATKFFVFDDYYNIKNEKEEISRLINLN